MESKLRTLLGRVFPYVRALEDQVAAQTEANKKRIEDLELREQSLLERIMRLTTGYGLKEEMPDAVELEKIQQDLKRKTLLDLLAEKEAASKKAFQLRMNRENESPTSREEESPNGDPS